MAHSVKQLLRDLVCATALALLVALPGCEKKADPDAALLVAVRGGDVPAAREAIDAGANPDLLCTGAEDTLTDGYPALAVAAYERDADMVAMLLETGADPTMLFKEDHTPLTTAARSGDVEIFDMLYEVGGGRHPLIGQENEGTLLHVAAAAGRGDVVTYLVARDLDFEQTTNNGHTSLMLAARAEDPSAFGILLDMGSNPLLLDIEGTSVLHYSLISFDLDRVEILLAQEVPLEENSGWFDGQTPLIYAAENFEEAVPLLLDAGAEVGARDGKGQTALFVATYYADPPTVRVLLEHGSEVDARNEDGVTPLAEAVLNNKPDPIPVLLEFGADPLAVIQPTGQTVYDLALKAYQKPGDYRRKHRNEVFYLLEEAIERKK